MDNDDPRLAAGLQIHIILGVFVLALILVRFAVRLSTARPARARTGSRLLDRLAPITHYGFYILTILIVSSGLATAFLTGLPGIIFGDSSTSLPERFTVYPSFIVHTLLAELLVLFILLHVVAALYHHFVRKDGLLSRMTFARRGDEPLE